jgi:hypothetical protein
MLDYLCKTCKLGLYDSCSLNDNMVLFFIRYLILYEFINYTKSYTGMFTPPCSTCRERKRLLTGHLKLKCV